MKIALHNRDIIEVTEADTVVIPVDGSGPRMEGNLARHFMRHVGVDDMDELYDPPPRYPFTGDTHWSSLAAFEQSHFEHLCCLGILSHQLGADHKGHLRSAFRGMLMNAASRADLGSRLACPILTGGKRIPAIDAIYVMVAELDAFAGHGGATLELHLAERDPARFALLESVVRC